MNRDTVNFYKLFFSLLICCLGCLSVNADENVFLESDSLKFSVDSTTVNWSLFDKRSSIAWPSEGKAVAAVFKDAKPEWHLAGISPQEIRFEDKSGMTIVFQLTDNGRSLSIQYACGSSQDIQVLNDALAIQSEEQGYVIVPCREGLLIPADGEKEFKKSFGSSEYEGCHMNMLGFVKKESALIVTWDDAYVWADVQRAVKEKESTQKVITASLTLRKSARSFTITPLGKGDWNTVAKEYRAMAEKKGYAVSMKEKILRQPHAELLLGAANVKLWTCLARRMNDDSTKEESVNVNWTFDEAASVAEHIHNDLGIERCLFTIGGWTEGGYDCRHPDNLPANPECGGNDALANAVSRIQKLGYAASLHDNYQDMYKDAKSWNESCIEKKPDGSLILGGRWLGGKAYMVCAPKQVEMAMRPQNLPEIQKLFNPWSYFIDTTYAVGPRECFDPNHPIGRNDDIAWKIKLSQNARDIFGLFGSECGREWALPYSDFFEGLVGVAGTYYHNNIKLEDLNAKVIPFWEMVYHDCQACYGKYGYSEKDAAEYTAHHILTARPLNYHSIPDHLYWKNSPPQEKPAGDLACYLRSDNGWAAGFYPTDVFLKNTQEVLGPLNLATAHQRLEHFEYLNPEKTLRRAVYGNGKQAAVVTVNFSTAEVNVKTKLGGDVVLPAWGFTVETPNFAAFYAKQWNGIAYPAGSLFTIFALENKTLETAQKFRIFHAFGDSNLKWAGEAFDVPREAQITLTQKNLN